MGAILSMSIFFWSYAKKARDRELFLLMHKLLKSLGVQKLSLVLPTFRYHLENGIVESFGKIHRFGIAGIARFLLEIHPHCGMLQGPHSGSLT
jgi:hypothetical protein